MTILGSYIPGAAAYGGWVEPSPYIASVRPDLLRDPKALYAQTPHMAFEEARRRPVFHAARILSAIVSQATGGEGAGLYWSLSAPEVLPKALRQSGIALARRVYWPLIVEMAVIQGLFLAAVIIAIRRRNIAILVLALAVLLKYGFHSITVAHQGRYFLVATAWEILAITVAAYEIRTTGLLAARWLVTGALIAGAAWSSGLFLFAPRLAALVQSRDPLNQQRTYRFRLEPPSGVAALECQQGRGSLELDPLRSATIRTLNPNPAPGDEAVAVCELTGSGDPRPVMLQVLCPSAAGALPGRMMLRIEFDGVEVYSRDMAASPTSGWADIPLGDVGKGTKGRVTIEVRAIQPDASAAWGITARTSFRLAEGFAVSHLAVGRPASQSSTLSRYQAAGAMDAVDGNTDGDFFHGSVTSTNLDTNAWWEVDLGASVPIGSIVIWNRTDCCPDRLSDYWVFVSDTPFAASDTPVTLQKRPRTWSSHQTGAPQPSTRIAVSNVTGRYIRVQLSGTNYLSLAEVQVFGRAK